MKYFFHTFSIVMMLFTVSVYADATIRVIDRGVDGDERYYQVVCPNEKRTSVVNRFKIKQVCVYKIGEKEETCRSNWNPNQAAKYGCK
jgi:hypothetical protein